MTTTHDVIEPATEAILASLIESSPDEVDAAIERSRAAQRS
jgi:acyl-CoA reductase-like NAD-dependent aldehyde dehydrogenase